MNIEVPYSQDNLELSFEIILSQKELKPYIQDICELIVNKTISIQRIVEIQKEYNVNKKDAQEDFIDLILYYIELALKDNILTESEKNNIKYLKRIFKVEERSFYKHKKHEIASILKTQLQRIYLNDLKVDNIEALFKVDLQELFNLSYDEFLEFTNEEALFALGQGAKLKDLDTYIKDFQQYEEDLPPEKPSTSNEKIEIRSESEKENQNSETNIKNNSIYKTPNGIFFLEIILLSYYIYHETDIVLLAIGCFVLLAFLIQIEKIALILALVFSLIASLFVFDLSGMWIVSVIFFIIWMGIHILNDDSTTKSIRSRQIPSSVKKQVWERDNARCVICGSNEELEFDHDIPFSKGGSNSVKNIRLLCKKCNRSKSHRIE